MQSGSLQDADVSCQTMLQLTHSLSGSKGTVELLNCFYSSLVKFQALFPRFDSQRTQYWMSIMHPVCELLQTSDRRLTLTWKG